jgi:hypothetical protein
VPGCFACHVTGYRQEGGYRSIGDLAKRHVQCESCHGPGEKHLLDPAPRNIIGVPPQTVCLECHDRKHSDMDDANFGAYWAKVVHLSPRTGVAARRASGEPGHP